MIEFRGKINARLQTSILYGYCSQTKVRTNMNDDGTQHTRLVKEAKRAFISPSCFPGLVVNFSISRLCLILSKKRNEYNPEIEMTDPDCTARVRKVTVYEIADLSVKPINIQRPVGNWGEIMIRKHKSILETVNIQIANITLILTFTKWAVRYLEFNGYFVTNILEAAIKFNEHADITVALRRANGDK